MGYLMKKIKTKNSYISYLNSKDKKHELRLYVFEQNTNFSLIESSFLQTSKCNFYRNF